MPAFFFLAATALRAQTPPAPEINFFAADFPPPAERRNVRVNQIGPPMPIPAPEYHQTILFHNGRQLRGELAEITKDEVLWRRNDASEPLRFSRAEVRRVLLVPPERLTSQFAMNSQPTTAGKGPPPPATIKLPGGDWLRGAITSPDGQKFALALAGNNSLELDRSQIEWLHFGPKAAPAFGMGDGPMALDGWLSGNPPRIESKDGTLTVLDTPWIGRVLANPARFEVAFEVPENGEEGLRIWLQPFNPQPNSYSTGTVQFCLGKKALKWLVFTDNIQPNNLELPAESQAETGPVRYRILYDGTDQQVILLRNGRQLGNWSLKAKDDEKGLNRQNRLPRGVCFDREQRNNKSNLQFRQLSVRPWDGVIPDAAAPAVTEDRLSTPTTPPVVGRLEAVREKELLFAGQPYPLAAETFVQFSSAPMLPLSGAETLLSFGEQGEVSLADLRMSEGKLRGRSVFAPALQLPAGALQFITFAPQAAATLTTGDLLVFKNGDELPGALLTAATGAPLRWRLATGQEIDFQTERIAGVRLTSSVDAKPAGAVELRTGERLRGEVVTLDDQQLRWKNTLLGELALSRAQLWRLYPKPRLTLRDGGQDPASWLRDTQIGKSFISYTRVRPRSQSWLALDGRFILRTREGSGGEQALGPACELGGGPDRFELRLEVASPGENAGNLNVTFTTPGEGGVTMNLSSYEMSLYVQNPKSPNGGGNRELPFRDKLGENVRQFSVRALVNGPAGTIDFFLNGYYLGRSGLNPAERLPGIGQAVTINAYTYNRAPLLLSEVAITPWSGELPRPGPSAGPVTVLANGDVTSGAVVSTAEGGWRVESEIGPLELSGDKVQAVEFGGEMKPTRAAGRVRLVDGSALLVESFQWTKDGLVARHSALGEWRVPASAVTELIYDPAPARMPTVVDPKKLARQTDGPANPLRP